MNTKLAISLLTDSQNSLTKSLAGLGLLTNGESIRSLLVKVDQSEKAAVSQYKQLSGKVDVLNVNINITNDALVLANAENRTSQDRLLAIKKQQSDLNALIKTLSDRKTLITKNADSKKVEIKAGIDTIKNNIAATESDITQVKQQIQAGAGNLSLLQATLQSKTIQLWAYYSDLEQKNNLLSVSTKASSQDLELIDVQISQQKVDLQQLQKIDIPAQEKVAQVTNQRVNDVQTSLGLLCNPSVESLSPF